jgi:hypothetical protein
VPGYRVEIIQIDNQILNLYGLERRPGSDRAWERRSTDCSPSGGMTLYFSEGDPEATLRSCRRVRRSQAERRADL